MKRTRLLLISAALLALACGAAAEAGAETPSIATAGNLELAIEGGLTPKLLPSRQLAPVTLHVDGLLRTADGSPPPALRQIVLDSDRNAVVNAAGLPACSAGKLRATSTEQAIAACPKAIVGRGTTEVEVAFPEQAPFTAVGPLVFFNGGVRGGTTTVYAHAYVSVPAPTAVVVTLKVTKESKGRFGLHTVATVPLIAGGAGSVVAFDLKIDRTFEYRGERMSFLEARCVGGHFVAAPTFEFRDGSKVAATIVRSCQAEN